MNAGLPLNAKPPSDAEPRLNTRPARRQRGVASVEYVVVTMVIVTALFLPVAGGLSAIDLLMNALRSFQLHSTYLMSLP